MSKIPFNQTKTGRTGKRREALRRGLMICYADGAQVHPCATMGRAVLSVVERQERTVLPSI
jgi:hypothetical protein